MTERKRLVKKLDALCRLILLTRDRVYGKFYRCISCNQLLDIAGAQVGHYISRRYESVRWDLLNINLQCPACNNWKKGNQIEYRKALVEKYGLEEVEKLETFYKSPPGYTVFDLSQMVNEYQKKLSEYTEGVCP